MKKLIVSFAIFSALLLGMSGTAFAGHRHSSGCGHRGYGYHYQKYRTSGYANYWHDHYARGRSNRCHYYGGNHHYSVGYAPVYVAPAYPNYWHNHGYGSGYRRCHYYSGRHHYGNYYRPQSGFHFGISIFR